MRTTLLLVTVRRMALVLSLVIFAAGDACGETYSKIFAFGDSLSDLGNTYNALGGTTDDELIYYELGYTSQPGRYDNGRWSNGTLWVEHVNTALNLPTLRRNNGIEDVLTGLLLSNALALDSNPSLMSPL